MTRRKGSDGSWQEGRPVMMSGWQLLQYRSDTKETASTSGTWVTEGGLYDRKRKEKPGRTGFGIY